MAGSLYDFSVDPRSPNFRPTGVMVNPIPGTDWAATAPQDFGINTKEGSDAFNAMIYRISNGLSGAPMPPPIPPDPRIEQSRLYSQAQQQMQAARATAAAPAYSPVVRRALTSGRALFQNRAPVAAAAAPAIKPGLTTIVKSPAQQGRLSGNVAQFSTGPAGQAKANSLTQFTQDFIDDRKKQKANYDQESAHVGRTFDPNGLELDLRNIAKQRTLLGRSAAESAIRRAGRDAAVSRMVGGGVNSSYLDRAYGDVLGRILMEQAVRGSDIDRENAMYVQGQRNGSVGTRAQLGQNYVNSALDPYRYLTDLQAGDLANIGRMGNIEDNYSIYDYVTPDAAARRNLNLLSDLEETQFRFGA